MARKICSSIAAALTAYFPIRPARDYPEEQQLEEALGEVVGWAVATVFMVTPDYEPRSVAESVRVSPTEA